METSLNDFANMSDQALTAYLFGLAVGCPLGLAKHECPLLELQQESLSTVYDLLVGFDRETKLRLVARHYGCAEWKDGRLPTLAAAPG